MHCITKFYIQKQVSQIFANFWFCCQYVWWGDSLLVVHVLQGVSQTMTTLKNLVHKGVKVELGLPFEMWDEPSVEVSDMKKQVGSTVLTEQTQTWKAVTRSRSYNLSNTRSAALTNLQKLCYKKEKVYKVVCKYVCVLSVRDNAWAVRGRGGGMVLPSSGPATGELPVSGACP